MGNPEVWSSLTAASASVWDVKVATTVLCVFILVLVIYFLSLEDNNLHQEPLWGVKPTLRTRRRSQYVEF